MRPTLAQLNVLSAVVRAGSVSGAARDLRMTQSGISQSLIALEKLLGNVLLTRTRNGVNPTAFAMSILADARTALEAVDRIEALARASAPTSKQELRIAGVPSVVAHRLPEWRKSFRQRHPFIELSVFEGSHIEVGEWVSSGIADLGIGSVASGDLCAEPLATEELVVIARHGHPVLRRETAHVKDLRLQRLVTVGVGCEPIIAKVFDAAGVGLPQSVRAQDIATALTMVRQGIGVAILPETALHGHETINLRVRHLTPPAHRLLYMLVLPENLAQTSVSRFIDVVRLSGPSTASH